MSSPLVSKAKSWASSAVDLLNNKSTKSLVNSLGNYIPQVKDFYSDAKRYANIGNQFLNKNGADKFINRTFPNNLSQRFQDRFKTKREPNIELQPRQQQDNFNLSSIF
jgi:hypothetical protein